MKIPWHFLGSRICLVLKPSNLCSTVDSPRTPRATGV
jgi:hypothetical protein